MFNKTKELEQRITELEVMVAEMINNIHERTIVNSKAIDLLADDLGCEIKVCDCCGEVLLNFINDENDYED